MFTNALPVEFNVPRSTDKILLLDPDEADGDKPFYNLQRISKEGKVIWVATFPEPSPNYDYYVSIGMDRDMYPLYWGYASLLPIGQTAGSWRLIANTFSGYFVLIDWDTGKPYHYEFTK